MKWDDLRIILAIARAGSLTAAGRRLGVNQSTVSRRLAAIEARLGTRLFDRGAGYAPTAAGSELLETAARIEEEIARVDGRVMGRDARLQGRLRVTCTDNFANSYLARHFARFVDEHPEIDLQVMTRYQYLNLARREADVAIRTTLKPPDSLIGRRLLKFALGVYAAPTYIERVGQSPDPSRISWIGWDNEAYNRIMITDHYPTANIRHRVDSLLDMASLARAGLGAAMHGCYSADPDPGLRRLYPEPVTDAAMDLWVLSHPDMRRVARVRAFTAFIADAILADRDLFEGRRPFESCQGTACH